MMDQNIIHLLKKNKFQYVDTLEIPPLKPKFIIIGDNPGVKELEHQKYFIGPSGTSLANKFESEGLVTDFRNECIIYNKTIIHTPKTSDLFSVREKIKKENFDLILKHTALVVTKLAKEYHIPVLVFGKSQLGKGRLFEAFWEELNKVFNKDKILVFNHPAYSLFQREWNQFVKNNPGTTCPEKILKKIGEGNVSRIKQTYPNS